MFKTLVNGRLPIDPAPPQRASPLLLMMPLILWMSVWIGVRLQLPQGKGGQDLVDSTGRLWKAIRTVIVADLVMSTDNVLAIAAVAAGAAVEHKLPVVVFGLLVSIPLIVVGTWCCG